ncbi:AAA family ATPase [Plantactinospora sp. KBS50]|uniref:AAA family ATPase n=1 Tax=Plantactinospora sp. KBS50 TaxID=2024580 RepID=UPI000BAAF38E|nr:AAA family ATPase [Plantactinospora sp. KBS50]ASW53724.1 hypothetical protein CIK06_05230 [Plantactinospora sp. KBS50]
MELFVGREAELTEAVELLLGAEEGRVLDIVGVRGIGKSAFLRQLVNRVTGRDGVVVRAVDLLSEGIGSGHHKRGEEASGNVISDTYLQSIKIMLRITDGHDRAFRAFRLAMLESAATPLLDAGTVGNSVSLGRRSQVGPITLTTHLQVPIDTFRDQVSRLQRQADDDFVAAWTAFTEHRRVLIVVDSAELIADDEIGAWLLRIAARLPRTLLVMARMPMLADFGRLSERLTRRHLDDLSADEVAAYLAARLIGEPVPDWLPAVVYGFTDGHPYGVALTAELIVQVGADALHPARLRRMLAQVPDDRTRWGALIKTLLDQVSEPLLTRAVSAAAIVHRFDEPMLADLLAPEGDRPVDGEVGEAMRALRAYRLAHPVLSVSGLATGWSRLHEFVRQAVDNRLRIDHRREWLRLHAQAADYCFRWLLARQADDDVGEYGAWYRYEDPEWQAYQREWLYHSGFVAQRREIARARFTLVFLEAFYWWGCYHPFPFNRQLIEDWERATGAWSVEQPATEGTASNAEQRLADALVHLLDHYPLGGHKPATAGWDEMRAQLLLIRELCGLTNSRLSRTAEDAAQLARTDALISVFLAHTRRYRDPADPAGERYYVRAQQAFERLDDDWLTAWMLRERADHALERGDWPGGARLWRAAVDRAERMAVLDEDWDHELGADLYRIRADAHWLAGGFTPAAVGYGRAVAEAYRFQNRPQPPDEYTQEYYGEITGRAADRVLELAQRRGVPAAERFAAELAAALPAGWERAAPTGTAPTGIAAAIADGDRPALIAALFPTGPQKGELHVEDSGFLQRWRLRWEDDPQDFREHLACEP